MRTRRIQGRLSRRRRFRGERRRATTTWAGITWCGRGTWCSRRRRCWRCGRTETARRALVYLACTQRPDGGFAQNFWIDGTAYWTGIQLDEVAFPIILAWRLWKLDGLGIFDVFPFVEKAASFLVRYAPVTQQERWEENAGYSPSTLAAVISALVCAADIAQAYKAAELAQFLLTYADWIEAHLDEWTTTNDGVLLPGVKRHYMRIRPPQPGEPFHNPHLPAGFIHLANRGPGEQADFDARESDGCGISGAGALWDPAGGRSADSRVAEGGGPLPQVRDAVRPLLAAIQP